MILPGKTIGILGSGQLGRMLSFVAKRMGYRVVIYSPDSQTPAGQVSDKEIVAQYQDVDALERFAKEVDVVTIEFENIAVEALNALAGHVPVHPSPQVLHTSQNRLREKTFLAKAGLPVTPFKQVDSADGLKEALEHLGTPAVMKTAGFGYDGKGQAKLSTLEDAHAAYTQLGGGTVILEAFINYQLEVSVIGSRNARGDYRDFGVIENEHRDHILDLSTAPSSLTQNIQQEAREIARATLEALDVIGVMCVEFFLTSEGKLLINEVAPRPHNSGHLTIEGCACSQFEQQLRAICNLPLGPTDIPRPTAMLNLLGDVWEKGEPDWAKVLSLPETHLHLYGKAEARAKRKMGHITTVANSKGELAQKIKTLRSIVQT
ncbi:MAG: 5-(carboxyamino)imidazole ribonucleotide synthase [Trueperaceae bacterium]|nr:5-(carboxyamino)imidazole ribonucleotide synthase [Trueperaceae bacterium]